MLDTKSRIIIKLITNNCDLETFVKLFNLSKSVRKFVISNHPQICYELLNHKRNNIIHYDLCYFSGKGLIIFVNYLIKKGAINFDDAMCCAAFGGHMHLINLFISKGANNWNWAMYDAIKGGHNELVNFFIEKGANNIHGGLCYAIKSNNRVLIDFFIEKNSHLRLNDISIINWNYSMYYAALGGYEDLIDLFIKKGADDWNLGMYAAVKVNNMDLVNFFIEKGADNWNDAKYYAAKYDYYDLVDFFAKKCN